MPRGNLVLEIKHTDFRRKRKTSIQYFQYLAAVKSQISLIFKSDELWYMHVTQMVDYQMIKEENAVVKRELDSCKQYVRHLHDDYHTYSQNDIMYCTILTKSVCGLHVRWLCLFQTSCWSTERCYGWKAEWVFYKTIYDVYMWSLLGRTCYSIYILILVIYD